MQTAHPVQSVKYLSIYFFCYISRTPSKLEIIPACSSGDLRRRFYNLGPDTTSLSQDSFMRVLGPETTRLSQDSFMRVYGQRAGSSTSDSFQEEINEASDSLFLEGTGQEAEEAETRRRRSVAAEVRRRMSADQERAKMSNKALQSSIVFLSLFL